MKTDYREMVLCSLYEDQQPAVIAAAEHLHSNESLHMHDRIDQKEPCSYCWLRAGKAYRAILDAGFTILPPERPDGGEGS